MSTNHPKMFGWILLLCFGSVLSDGEPPPFLLRPVQRTIDVPVSSPVGYRVTSVSAGDSPASTVTKYSMGTLKPEFDGFFAIDTKTGVITLNRSLSVFEKSFPNISLTPAVWNGHILTKVEIIVKVVPDSYTNPNPIQSFLPTWSRDPLSPPRTVLTWPPSFAPVDVTSSSSVQSFSTGESSATKPHKRGKTKKRPSEEGGTANGDDKSAEKADEPEEHERREAEERRREVEKSAPDLRLLWLLALGAGICVLAFVACLCYRKRKNERKEKLALTKSNSSDTGPTIFKGDHFEGKGSYPGFKHPLQMVVSTASGRYLYRKKSGDRLANTQIQTGPDGYLHPTIPEETWEFPRENIRIKDKIGEGCFGQVFVAEAKEVGERIATVAIKMLKEQATEKEKEDLLAELSVMKGLDPHPNIVELLGCCTERDPVMVIMEYVSLGKLQSFLRRSRNGHYYGNVAGENTALEAQDLTSFACQILHRDLAARNILVNENRVCKVCDFGLARDVINSHIYERKSEGRLPVRWMAPESLFDNIFSVKTDVWSFGILMWEIVTLGSTPYPGKSAQDVMKLVASGERLQQPAHCKRELWNIMFYCWNASPEERPVFSELVHRLENLLDTEENYLDLNKFPENSYYNTSIIDSMSGEKV